MDHAVHCRTSIQLLSFDRYRQMRELPISSIAKFLYLCSVRRSEYEELHLDCPAADCESDGAPTISSRLVSRTSHTR
jgi:hypothetical protein